MAPVDNGGQPAGLDLTERARENRHLAPNPMSPTPQGMSASVAGYRHGLEPEAAEFSQESTEWLGPVGSPQGSYSFDEQRMGQAHSSGPLLPRAVPRTDETVTSPSGP